jgi:hypothetical protein
MPKIKFTATANMRRYHDLPEDYADGTIKEISQVEFDRLTQTFPENFKAVVTEDAPVSNRMEKASRKIR